LNLILTLLPNVDPLPLCWSYVQQSRRICRRFGLGIIGGRRSLNGKKRRFAEQIAASLSAQSLD
jgi:hypothetical protein